MLDLPDTHPTLIAFEEVSDKLYHYVNRNGGPYQEEARALIVDLGALMIGRALVDQDTLSELRYFAEIGERVVNGDVPAVITPEDPTPPPMIVPHD